MESRDPQYHFWRDAFEGHRYYYGDEPGPVARRTVRYHRPWMPDGGDALDAGCGEGQDVVFLAERGYRTTGVDFTDTGVEKTRRLLETRGLPGDAVLADLREVRTHPELNGREFDLVLAVNSVQFMGDDASRCLDDLRSVVRIGGVIGVSLHAPQQGRPPRQTPTWEISLEDLLARFEGWQMLEAALLWQWSPRGPQDTGSYPQPFVTLIARRV